MRVEGKPITPPTPLDMHDGEQVTLEQYEDSQHGFMRVTVTKGALTGEYYTVAPPSEKIESALQLSDMFTLDLTTHRFTPH